MKNTTLLYFNINETLSKNNISKKLMRVSSLVNLGIFVHKSHYCFHADVQK